MSTVSPSSILPLAIAGLVTLVSLTGCGPVYKTHYSYRPPRSMAAQDCVRNCESGKELCAQRHQLDYERCQVDAERNYNDCLRHSKKKKDRESCYISHCSRPDSDECTQDYNRCFEICGGKVTATTTCVANCQVPE